MDQAQVGQFLSAEAYLRPSAGLSSLEGYSYLPTSPRTIDVGLFVSGGLQAIGCKARSVGNTFYIINLPFPADVSENSASVERIRIQLGRLRDGWCGPGSIAPTTETLSDLDRLLGTLDQGYFLPEVEVDQDTGHLTLRWDSKISSKCISLILKGNGNVLFIESQLNDDPIASSRSFPVSRLDDLSSYIARNQSLYETLYRA